MPDADLLVAVGTAAYSPLRKPLFADAITIAKAIILVNRLNDNYNDKSDISMKDKVIFFDLERLEIKKM
ncbi:hypothetical protein [Atlantibacter hermannii]|uniref:hypothetical protein n=1 Tax=Atlantibacter hermannii TaxID=565 RepID=UPI0028A5B883|nr:hypothetical protein [Atlantibacter hermannii]